MRLALLAVLCAALASCANNQCSIHSDCGPLHYCQGGSCFQDCRVDADCAQGLTCSAIGQCSSRIDGQVVQPDAHVPGPDARVDAYVPPGVDAYVPPGVDAHVPPVDAYVPPGTDASFDAGVTPRDAGSDGGSTTPLGPGTYSYSRVAIGGLHESVAVGFHPDGSYAVVLERSNGVHVYDWASGTAMRFDLSISGHTLYLSDVDFAPDGHVAWIVGYDHMGTADTGVVIALDDTMWRAGAGSSAFSRSSATATGERFTAIEHPRAASGGPAGDGRPVVLSQSGSSTYIARLRELDPATGAFGGLLVARATGAGCDDLAFADNEFGGWGIVLACGTNGADAPYYTSVAGVGEWRTPTGSLGNVSRAAAHPSGAYALIVNWSSGYLHRFQSGALLSTSSSPMIADGIWGISFAPDGRLALITGRARAAPLRGTVYEYRHDMYSASAITDVSIDGFDSAPYLGTSNTYLNASAFRPGCDGGLIVGGDVSTGTGLVIEFELAGRVSCR